MPTVPQIADLGRAGYCEARDCMLRVAASVRKGELDGKVLLVEHDPVYTAGRATRPEHLRGDAVAVERGGQLTYHGPGQLVVYPVMRLPHRDVRAWLRRLEAVGVAVCAAVGLVGTPSVDGTGVFVDGRKVVSIGVAIRHWINLHGLSINVDMDLAAFASIRPCGLDPAVMSDLSRLAGRRVGMDEAKRAVRDHLSLLVEERPPASRAAP